MSKVNTKATKQTTKITKKQTDEKLKQKLVRQDKVFANMRKAIFDLVNEVGIEGSVHMMQKWTCESVIERLIENMKEIN